MASEIASAVSLTIGPVRTVALDRGGYRQARHQFPAVVAHAGGNAAQARLDFLVVEGDAMAARAIDLALQCSDQWSARSA
jgi:hypothetical protein